MSELKHQLMLNKDMSWVPCYLKSKADKVIEELKDKCQMHDFFWEGCGFAKRGFKNAIAVSEAFDKLEAEVCHHKFKRCLAMARWCRTSARCDESLGAFKYRDWYWKWFNRWLELAEKFKEAK